MQPRSHTVEADGKAASSLYFLDLAVISSEAVTVDVCDQAQGEVESRIRNLGLEAQNLSTVMMISVRLKLPIHLQPWLCTPKAVFPRGVLL